MKHSKSDRRQIPVAEDPRPNDTAGDTPPDPEGENGQEDPTASLQADLDRFRDLALRSQADFDNYKKRCPREGRGDQIRQQLASRPPHRDRRQLRARSFRREERGREIPYLLRHEHGLETADRFPRR